MTTAPIETTSIPWQIDQFGRRVSEWFEVLFAPIMQNNRLPDWSLPDELLRGLFWLLTVGLIGWVGWQLYQLLRPYWTIAPTARLSEPTTGAEVQVSVARWLDRSRTFARQGNYREACRCLYYAALQQLDDAKLIPQEQSRTDGEYQTLVRSLRQVRPYQVLIDTHEQLCFGSREVTAEEFERCQQAYREIVTGN